VLALSRSESRVLVTEDKDFGVLAYAGGHETAGVILIRVPANARNSLGQAVVNVVAEFSDRLSKAFVVIEPGRARLSRPRTEQ
jgi:predicted nuclease of predicted toxin-antitoxin system